MFSADQSSKHKKLFKTIQFLDFSKKLCYMSRSRALLYRKRIKINQVEVEVDRVHGVNPLNGEYMGQSRGDKFGQAVLQ